jgi:hypothetical protein
MRFRSQKKAPEDPAPLSENVSRDAVKREVKKLFAES